MKRREWKWAKGNMITVESPTGMVVMDGGHIREVLPTDPDPEWVDELIVRCESLCTSASHVYLPTIREHLAKRGKDETT